jgi:hypothetical protein
MWVAVAGAENHPEALTALQNLTSIMSERQISQGQAHARKWIEEHPLDPEDDMDHVIYKPE